MEPQTAENPSPETGLEMVNASFGVPPGYRLVAIAGRVAAETIVEADAEALDEDPDQEAAAYQKARSKILARLRAQASALLGSEAVQDAGDADAPVGAVVGVGLSISTVEDPDGVHITAGGGGLAAVLSPSGDDSGEAEPLHVALPRLGVEPVSGGGGPAGEPGDEHRQDGLLYL